jgi:hypothetical protein
MAESKSAGAVFIASRSRFFDESSVAGEKSGIAQSASQQRGTEVEVEPSASLVIFIAINMCYKA